MIVLSFQDFLIITQFVLNVITNVVPVLQMLLTAVSVRTLPLDQQLQLVHV